jgi:uncharacterized membrane protein
MRGLPMGPTLNADPPLAAPPRLPAVRRIDRTAPLRWLRAGARDMIATGFRGVFYGLAFLLIGRAILAVYDWTWQFAWSLTAGFFLVGPFLCCGLYWLSRQVARGEPVSLRASLTCWRANPGAIGWMASILALIFIIWGRVSAVFFALVSTHDFASLDRALAQILSLANWPYLLAFGAITLAFGTLALAVAAVSMPMLVDRRADTLPSLATSVRAFWANKATLALWGVLVVALIAPSLAFGFVGLLVTAPLVGHATWHAYVEMVEPDRTSA